MNATANQAPVTSSYRAGVAYGPLESVLSGCMPGEATLTFHEGEPADAGHALEWMPRWSKAPTVTWEASGSSGTFDLTDFMAIASGAEPDHPFSIAVVSQNGLPFVALHPSGQIQAIRYDAYEEKFKRRILYATASEACAVQLRRQGADII